MKVFILASLFIGTTAFANVNKCTHDQMRSSFEEQVHKTITEVTAQVGLEQNSISIKYGAKSAECPGLECYPIEIKFKTSNGTALAVKSSNEMESGLYLILVTAEKYDNLGNPASKECRARIFNRKLSLKNLRTGQPALADFDDLLSQSLKISQEISP